MKTKKRKSTQQVEIFADDARPEPNDGPEIPGETEKKERFQVSFDLNPDGSPDLSSMRGRTKEKVQAFFSDPRIAAAFGAKPAVPEVQIFHPAAISGIYDLLGAIETAVAIRYGNVPPFIAKQVFAYSPAEKDALTGPTVRVLNKYAAEWMLKYQDEFALATLLTSLTITKINVCRSLVLQQRSGTIPGAASQEENTPEGYKKEGLDQDGQIQ